LQPPHGIGPAQPVARGPSDSATAKRLAQAADQATFSVPVERAAGDGAGDADLPLAAYTNSGLPPAGPPSAEPRTEAWAVTTPNMPPSLAAPSGEKTVLDARPGARPPAGWAAGEYPEVPGYEILGVLGRGGMGIVYQARQTSLKRLVALKMILAGSHAAPQHLARFRIEAEAVARLQHPNIVQIHEIGDRHGLPYFSLEFVDAGSLEDRLDGTPRAPRYAAELVETLARAMHYAHQQGVVHRDLKPANVLLTADGSPKISDFGLAKTMEGGDSQTKTGMILGTPSYMAPEQARGQSRQVGPATDVYALGAMLYDLLTGRPPFKAAEAMETIHQVLNQEPVPPRALQPSIPRDLETICLKCLEKDPGRRYASAQALADDLHRFLTGETIHARPATIWSRAGKWAKRRPAVATLLGISALAVLALLGVWAWFTVALQAERDNARRAQREAEMNFDLAMAAVEKMLVEVGHEKLAHEPRMQEKQRALLTGALAFYEKFLAAKSDDPRVRQKTGLAHKYMADILRLLGRREEARRAYGQAVELLDGLARASPHVPEYRHALADSHNWLGEVLRLTPLPEDALQAYRQAMALQEQLYKDYPKTPVYRKDLARSHYNVGIVLKDTNRPRAADAAFRLAIDHLAKLHGEYPKEAAYKQELARCLLNHGPVLRALGHDIEAEAAFRRSLGLLRELVTQAPGNADYRLELLVACTNAGNHWSQGQFTAVLAPSVVGLAAGASGLGPWQLATLVPARREAALRRAEGLHREAVELGQRLIKDYPGVPVYKSELAVTFINLGTVLVNREGPRSQKPAVGIAPHKRPPAPALLAWLEAQALLGDLVRDYPKNTDYLGDLGMTHGNIGWLLHRDDRWHEAVIQLHEGIQRVEAALKPNPRHPAFLHSLREQYNRLADTLLRLGRHQEAAKAALALPGVYGRRDGRDQFLAAQFLAWCIFQAEADRTLSTRQRQMMIANYVNGAMKQLQEAVACNYKTLQKDVESSPSFQPLLRRPEFAHFFATLGAAGKPER
jgi:tetratricopeptide (TPR) repeat protein